MKALYLAAAMAFGISVSAMAACPPGLNATSMPSCEVGHAALVKADSSCFEFSVMETGNVYSILNSDPGAATLRDALVFGKGGPQTFYGDGAIQQITCPNSRGVGLILGP